MIARLLYKLSSRLPCRLIKLEDRPYMERYYVGRAFGVTFYLHRFVSSDSEKHLHNHPWGWGRSVILTGGYVEEKAIDLCPTAGPSGCVTEMVARRWYNTVDGNTFHRIHNAKPETWTLFFHGERLPGKGWGFLTAFDQRTVFIPFKSKTTDWWKTAALGEQTVRKPWH